MTKPSSTKAAVDDRRLVISFSGGRTSGLMLRRLIDKTRDTNVVVTFANTSQEDERTLEFVHKIDCEWGIGIVWLEAVVNPGRGNGTTHKVVSFDTADRSGAVFESVIAKYGIPNKGFPGACTRELKLRAITSYLRSIGWGPGTYDTAIGIRADEFDRMDSMASEKRFIYPLIADGITKDDVLAWWRTQPFDLGIPEHFGNCRWCWKKSLRKHLTLVKECPEAFDFPRRMEAQYAHAGSGTGPRTFFRNYMTVDDLFDLAQHPFDSFRDKNVPVQPPSALDIPGGGCGESCEIYADGIEEAEAA